MGVAGERAVCEDEGEGYGKVRGKDCVQRGWRTRMEIEGCKERVDWTTMCGFDCGDLASDESRGRRGPNLHCDL